MSNTRIVIESGKIRSGTERLKRLIRSAGDGPYMVSLEEWKTAKTWQQLKFAHVCFDKYSDYTGYTRDESKDLLKRKYGFNRLYKDQETGSQYLLIRSLADYSKEQMSVFIDRMLNHFEHDLGFIIDPELRKEYEIDYNTGELISP